VHNRTFVAVVIVFWLSTMTWLVVEKVLPPLLIGDPPTHRAVAPEPEQVVAWTMSWRGQEIGSAATKLVEATNGAKELYSRVKLDRLPLRDVLPSWLQPLLSRHLDHIDVDAKSRTELDPNFRLARFRSTVKLSEIENAIRLLGRVEDSQLRLQVQVSELKYEKSVRLDNNAFLGDEFSPQAKLPGLFVGRAWTIRTYSAFHAPSAPVEILQAEVEREEMINWNGHAVLTHVVVYRPDSGAGLSSAAKPRGKMWVAMDGRVLRQEILLLDSELQFTRVPDEKPSGADLLDDPWFTGVADLEGGGRQP